MSDANLIQFRQYADEALRGAGQSKNEKKRGTGPGRACARLDASGGERVRQSTGPCAFRLSWRPR